MSNILKLILLPMILVSLSCDDRDQERGYYTADNDACNTTCGFDHDKAKSCFESASVQIYTKDVLLEVILEGSRLIKENNVCVCASAGLESNGTFSRVTIEKSNNTNASKALTSYLESVSFVPVPSDAQCLLEKPIQPLPLSFRSASG